MSAAGESGDYSSEKSKEYDILKMGDPRLLRVAEPVTSFDTPELHQLVGF
jgi:hypothetical protein